MNEVQEGCNCVSEFTEKLRAQFGDDLWVDHVNSILEDGKTHMNGRFTVTVYGNRYPDESVRKQFIADFCPVCGEKYPGRLTHPVKEIAHSIDLNLSQKLRDQDYRRKFFLAESSAQIAAQLIALRKRRGLNQKEVAEVTGTQQPAISRAEQADYQNWSFNTLRSIADALDARIRVLIEPSEDVLKEYERPKEENADI